MNFFETVEKRHSYRGAFTDQPISREDLRKIVAAGLAAPSGKNMQTTCFVIVDDPEILARIAAISGASLALQTARAVIACVVDRQPEKVYEGMSFEVEDCAAAVQNMLLALTALGYASVWVDGWLRVGGRADELGAILDVPDGKVTRIVLPIGVAADVVQGSPKKPFEERAWFNGYGQTTA